ncbi:MAG TPA: hypothetical protein DHS36_01225 [Candidatus Veblenbacteria bacterium]|nr:MAG: hypothetical protein A2226_03725 [Candidatus Veblenbacteria bacterium RIFOXYA2_FULL_43_9]HCX38870.1 hypothetical protein [Candidatus Veblenbacteria bacterium]
MDAELTSQTIKAAENFQIAQSYFSDILNETVVIFSLIVAAIVTILVSLYFLFNWKVSQRQIHSEVDKAIATAKNEILSIIAEFKEQINKEGKESQQRIADDLKKHEQMLTYLRGEICRQMGLFWESEKSYNVAFIWFLRAANYFASSDEESLARTHFNFAVRMLNKVEGGKFSLDPNIVGEYQSMLEGIDDKKYRLEKQMLEDTIKVLLSK